MKQAVYDGILPQTYAEFLEGFSLDHLDQTISMVIALIEKEPAKTIDWVFRVYTTYYSLGRWDPHYYTALYAAFHFYLYDDIQDITACRMAVDQAIRYFAAGIAPNA
jgi:hypothetical protein